MNKAYVYILECYDKTYYTGYTTNLKKRIISHNNKKASKYTRTRTPVKYVFTKEFNNKNEAMSYESKVKRLTRLQKEKLIQNPDSFDELFNN
ncbi:MAG: GIY-YIG nuclease family protein [Helcococcus sp.]|nr:GIY-YIG nuclease family protein [Helcococcus sp.]